MKIAIFVIFSILLAVVQCRPGMDKSSGSPPSMLPNPSGSADDYYEYYDYGCFYYEYYDDASSGPSNPSGPSSPSESVKKDKKD